MAVRALKLRAWLPDHTQASKKRSGVLLFSITVAATVAAQPRVQSVHSELQGTLRKALYRKASCIFKFLICLRSFLSSCGAPLKLTATKADGSFPADGLFDLFALLWQCW